MKTSTIRKWLRLSLAAGLGALLALPALAQEDALKAFPGYVDFGELNSIFGEPTVQIAIGESLLGLVSTLSAEEDPEVAALFRKLNGVRVNVFETEAWPWVRSTWSRTLPASSARKAGSRWSP